MRGCVYSRLERHESDRLFLLGILSDQTSYPATRKNKEISYQNNLSSDDPKLTIMSSSSVSASVSASPFIDLNQTAAE